MSRSVWTADELMAHDFPPMRWAVDGVLAEGVNLLAGAPKFGKSWMALGLSVAIASGGRAFGRVPVDRGDVLYLALEDTGRRLQDRLRKLLNGDCAPSRLVLSTRWDGIEAVDRWLAEHPDARLVVVDVLAKIRPPSLRGESLYSADYRALEPLSDLAQRHRVCFLVPHHTRKASGEDFVDEVSGSFGLTGSADAILLARRSRNTGAAIVKITGRDVEEHDLALEFDPHTAAWTLLDGPAVLHEVGPTRRLILEALDGAAPMTPSELAKATGAGLDLVKQTVRRMDADGQLLARGGRYRIPTPPLPLSLVSLVSPNGDRGDAGDTPTGGRIVSHPDHIEEADQ